MKNDTAEPVTPAKNETRITIAVQSLELLAWALHARLDEDELEVFLRPLHAAETSLRAVADTLAASADRTSADRTSATTTAVRDALADLVELFEETVCKVPTVASEAALRTRFANRTGDAMLALAALERELVEAA